MAQDNFSKQAEAYAKYRPGYPPDLFDFILGHLAERKAAWDCATGPGKVAVTLAEYFEQVYASDISSEQLSHAPARENITYACVPAEDSGYSGDLFDLITVAQAIHWFDFDLFYEEVRRTAKTEALLAVIGYGMVRINDDIDPLLDEFHDFVFGKYFSENRKYFDERYQNLPFPFEEIDSPGFESNYRWNLRDVEGYLNSWSAVQKFKNNDGFNPVDDFIEELSSYWPADEKKDVGFPVFLRLGRIGKLDHY